MTSSITVFFVCLLIVLQLINNTVVNVSCVDCHFA